MEGQDPRPQGALVRPAIPARAVQGQAPRPHEGLVRPAIPAHLPEGASDEELLAGMQSQAVVINRQRARGPQGTYQQACQNLRAANDQRLNQLAQRQAHRQAREARNAPVPPAARNPAHREGPRDDPPAPHAHARMPPPEPAGMQEPAGPVGGNDGRAGGHEQARVVPAAEGPGFEGSDNPWARAAWQALRHERPLLDATVLVHGRPAERTPLNAARQAQARGPTPAQAVPTPTRLAPIHRQPGNRAPVRIAFPDYAAVERARAKAREESWVQLEKAAAEQRQAAAVQRDLHIRFPSARARAHHMSSMKGKGKVADAPCHRDDFFTQDACGICMEGAAVVGYLPCRHLVACLSCQRTMGVHRPCPVCRSRIKSFKLVLAADVQAHAAAPDVQPAA